MTTAHPELLFDKGPGTTVEVKGEIRQSLKNIYFRNDPFVEVTHFRTTLSDRTHESIFV